MEPVGAMLDRAGFERSLRGLGWNAVEPGEVRLLPIIMTTLTMIFGMLPIAMAMGDGAASAPRFRAR